MLFQKAKLALLAKMDVDKFLQKLPEKKAKTKNAKTKTQVKTSAKGDSSTPSSVDTPTENNNTDSCRIVS